jgi:small-conductance mechanosensitive channel
MNNNPWQEWWQDTTFQWQTLTWGEALRQLAMLGVILVLALIVDRILERHRARWLGDEPGERRIRSVLLVAKFPLLVLLLGYLALYIHVAIGWPDDALRRVVLFFWFVAAYAIVAKTVTMMVPAHNARQIIRRILLPLLAVLGVLHLTGLLPVLWTWASQVVITLESERVTLASIVLGLGIVAGFWLVARWGKTIFLRTILPRTHADLALARSIASFVQFVVIAVGLWIAFGTLGVEFSSLTLLLSALTVGVGFGLQDVVKNVMGGVILLTEGHIRPGEMFKIGGETGVVERIGLRSTTIRALDKAQVIVPNSYLIAEKVSDLTGLQRLEVTVGVACDSDPRLAERLLHEIAQAHSKVLDDPPPSVYFTNLGESTFDFTLYCFVADRSEIARTKSDLHYAIVETFRQYDLEMPYPQREVHVRGSWGQVVSSPARANEH